MQTVKPSATFDVTLIAARLHHAGHHIRDHGPRSHKFDLYQHVHITLRALRHNLTQAMLSTVFECSQATTSRVI